MNRYLIKNILTISLIASVFSLTGCSRESPRKSSCTQVDAVKPNPRGAKDEKIAYHQEQIKKYEKAIDQENKKINQGLRDRQMCEVRQAKNRKAKYEKKIQYHQQQLEKLYQ